jgi:hypothetical protein
VSVKRCILAGLLLPGSTALAVDLHGHGPLGSASVQVNSDLEIRYHHVDDKLENFEDMNVLDYAEQVERINLLLVQEGLAIGVQVDEVAFFGNRYILDGELEHERPLYDPNSIRSPFPDALVRLEKVSLIRKFDHVEWSLGDTYASFGRGMALNIIKNTDIDLDTSIRGIRSVVTVGDIEMSAVTGLSNTQQISQDNSNLLIAEDIQHMVSGARVEHYGLGPAQVGMHSVVYRFGRSADADRPPAVRYQEDLDAVVSGVTVALPSLAGVDWFVEGDLYDYQNSEISGHEDGGAMGHALYGSASFYPGKTSVLLEAKATRDTERLNTFVTSEGWEVASVPTLEYERVITEDSSAAINSNDIVGARARVDLAIKPGELMGYASVAGFQDNETGGLHFNSTPETIAHGITGLQWFEGGRVLQLNAGYRMDQREDSSEGADRLAHLDGDLSLPVGGADHIELAFDIKRFSWGNNLSQQEDFTEMANAITWHHGKTWMLQLYQDWTDNPLIRSEGNLAENLYGALELTYKPRAGSQVKAFYGAYKAGIRCAGGQCRSLPGYEGARVSWQTVF